MEEDENIRRAGDVTAVPDDVMRLAEALSRIHGQVIVALESGGMHLYMASPAKLEGTGDKELRSMHLAVNADRFFGRGEKWSPQFGQYDHDLSAMCMSTGTPYRVNELLYMPPLADRGIKTTQEGVKVQNTKRYLVADGLGNMVPEGPGETVRLTDLPEDHPGVVYLKNRNYDLALLQTQFNARYCTKELQQDPHPDVRRFYRRLPVLGFDTPQQRIIFFAYVNGEHLGWQGRVLDQMVGDCRWVLHPYSNEWIHVETRSEDGKMVPVPDIALSPLDWKLSKYKFGRSCQRNGMLMGVDAAVEWNTLMKTKLRTCILCEGPLDAGRWGPPGVALLGKYLSQNQADLLIKNFDQVLYVSDGDSYGMKSRKRVGTLLYGKIKSIEFLDLPAGKKDPGELTPDTAWAMVMPYMFS